MEYQLELIRIDGDERVCEKEFLLADGNALIIGNAPEVGVNHLRTNDALELRISESCVVDQRYLETAKALCMKYRTLIPQAVIPELIVFVVDQRWEKTDKSNDNSDWKIDISKAGGWLRALTGYRFEIKMRQYWIDEWTPAQLEAAIFSQLLRINPKGDGTVKKYSLDFQDTLTATFGTGYLTPGVNIPSLLDETVKIHLAGFKEASGQITIGETLAGAVEDEPVSEPVECDSDDVEPGAPTCSNCDHGPNGAEECDGDEGGDLPGAACWKYEPIYDPNEYDDGEEPFPDTPEAYERELSDEAIGLDGDDPDEYEDDPTDYADPVDEEDLDYDPDDPDASIGTLAQDMARAKAKKASA